MAFWRIRTTVDERPGRLASLASALAAKGGNILGLSVHPGTDGTVDEFLADIPAPPELVREALEQAGGRRVQVVPATAHELADEPTRVLLLASRLRCAPWRLPELLAELLRADDGRWVYGSHPGDPKDPGTPKEPGESAGPGGRGQPGQPRERGEPAGPGEGRLPDPTLLTVPVAARRAVRLRRAGLPFTLGEAARAAAFARLAQPPVRPARAERQVSLDDGAELTVRPLTPIYREAVGDLHRRCSPDTLRLRYFTAIPTLPPRVFDRLCDRGRGHSLVAGHDGQVRALATLAFTADPGIVEMAFLVEDAWQGRGLGTALGRMLVREACDLGFAEARATLAADNARMRRLLLSLGATITWTDDPGMLEARLPLGVPAPA